MVVGGAGGSGGGVPPDVTEVIVFDGDDIGLLPYLFVASTVNVYDEALRFVNVQENLAVVHVRSAGWEETLYRRIRAPPFETGADQCTTTFVPSVIARTDRTELGA